MSTEITSQADTAALFAGAQAGDRHLVARALSILESDAEASRRLDQLALAAPSRGLVVGVTGAPGAGKSSLVDLLIGEALNKGRVGVVAIDPSSPFSRGAILGDRVRMSTYGYEDRVFIRSLASRGASGGLSLAARRSVRLLLACGYETVFVETAGVGQIELDIAGAADEVIVVLTPNSGDEVQAAKAGILEIADVYAVNKSDLPGVDAVVKNLSHELALGDSEKLPPIVATSTVTKEGVGQLWREITILGELRRSDGELESRRANQRVEELMQRALVDVRAHLESSLAAAVGDQVRSGAIDPATGAEMVVSELLKERA